MRHIRIILSAVAVAATLFAVTFCSGRSDKELKAIVLDMCRYIPDHGMRDDA